MVVVVGLALVGGCGPSTSIVSARAPGRTETLSNVFVISQVGSKGEVSAERFEKTLVQTAETCGIRIGVTRVSRLDLDPDIHLERMKQFDPLYVLILEQAGGVTGAAHWTYYDARLFEAPRTAIWRADVRLHVEGALLADAGEKLAMDLLRKLRADRLILPCAKLVDLYAAPPQPLTSGLH
jgi:hypothetical protein